MIRITMTSNRLVALKTKRMKTNPLSKQLSQYLWSLPFLIKMETEMIFVISAISIKTMRIRTVRMMLRMTGVHLGIPKKRIKKKKMTVNRP